VNFDELKLKVKSQWTKINFSDGSLNFLLKRNRIFLLVFSLAIFSYGAYLWYGCLYHPGWSADKKQAYIESKKEEEVVFNKNKFNKIMAEIENRKNYFQKSVENVPDIFSLK
jgi:hypothetical protein